MKQWAEQVDRLGVRCAECQRIASRIRRGEPLLSAEKAHLERDVAAAHAAWRERVRDGVAARQLWALGKRGR
jgi:hypothetical protein